jgi:hypothetical protein
MSVSLCWRPKPPRDSRSLEGFLGSTGLVVLRSVFGDGTSGRIQLNLSSVDRLRAMAVVETREGRRSAYNELADLVEKHEAIEVWGEW